MAAPALHSAAQLVARSFFSADGALKARSIVSRILRSVYSLRRWHFIVKF